MYARHLHQRPCFCSINSAVLAPLLSCHPPREAGMGQACPPSPPPPTSPPGHPCPQARGTLCPHKPSSLPKAAREDHSQCKSELGWGTELGLKKSFLFLGCSPTALPSALHGCTRAEGWKQVAGGSETPAPVGGK